MTTLYDWNVVVSIREGAYKQAKTLLNELGTVGHTPYYNILVMWVLDVRQVMDELLRRWQENPEIKNLIGHFIPVSSRFHFTTPEEFEQKAKQSVLEFVPQLAGKRFHVRMHRRGFKDRIGETHEESMLGKIILEALEKAGTPASITFDNPDAVLLIETVGQQAGLVLWSEDDLKRYPFLHMGS